MKYILSVLLILSVITVSKYADATTPKLLLHMNSSFGDSSLSSHGVAVNGPEISTAQPLPNFGGASGLFDGAGDHLEIEDSNDFYFDGDFTIHMFLKLTSLGVYQTVYRQSDGGRLSNGPNYIDINISDVNRIIFQSDVAGSNSVHWHVASPGFIAGQWQHIAIVREGDNWSCFVDGDSKMLTLASGSYSNSLPDVSSKLWIGSGVNGDLNGWLDDVVIVKGEALWNTNFTPPVSETQPEVQNGAPETQPGGIATPQLLLHMNSAPFEDSSVSGHDVTASDAQINTEQPLSNFGGASGLFDGAGDYLTIPDSDEFHFNCDFTMHMFLKLTSLGVNQTVYRQSDGGRLSNGPNYVNIYISNINRIIFQSDVAGSNSVHWHVASPGFIAGQWQHIAIVREGNSWYCFVDGEAKPITLASGSYSNALANVASDLWIGSGVDGDLNGRLDDFVIVKGEALWNTNFTPPTSETQQGEVSMLSSAYQRGADPTSAVLEAALGPFTPLSYQPSSTPGYGDGTIWYPDPADVSGPFAAIVVCPGYAEGDKQIDWLGARLASNGFVVITISTNNGDDKADSRKTQQLLALNTIITENNTAGSPISGLVDADRVGLIGHSLGGAGALMASINNTWIDAVVPIASRNSLINGSFDQPYEDVKADSLVIACEDDLIAQVDTHALLYYNSLPNDKAFLEISGDNHFCGNTGHGHEILLGKYIISWMKIYLDLDLRYQKYLSGPEHDADYPGVEISRYFDSGIHCVN